MTILEKELSGKDTALKLIYTIDKYIAETSKKDYIFTQEEEYFIELATKRLSNHINTLIDYELKRKEVK